MIPKSYFILVFILACVSEGLLAQTQTHSQAEQELLMIRDRLLFATGFHWKDKKVPHVVLRDRQSRGASYNHESNTIELDLVAYEICGSFGNYKEAALAFLIGHELGHFYYETRCGKGMGLVDGAHRMLDYIYTKTTNESSPELQADIFGVMMAHLAQYRIALILDGLLDAFEVKYPSMTNGYPSVSLRQQVNNMFVEKCRELIRLNELATLLQLTRNYEASAVCYQQLLKEFESPEVYNNLAVCKLEQALRSYDNQVRREDVATPSWRFAFSFEIDHQFRLFGPDTRSIDEERTIAQVLELLEEAEHSLNRAIRLNPLYATAYLNKGWIALMKAGLTNATQSPNAYTSEVQNHLKSAVVLAEKATRFAQLHGAGQTKSGAELCFLLAKAKQVGLASTQAGLVQLSKNAPEPIKSMANINLAMLTDKLDYGSAERNYGLQFQHERHVKVMEACAKVTLKGVESRIDTEGGHVVLFSENSCALGDFIHYSYDDKFVFMRPKNSAPLTLDNHQVRFGDGYPIMEQLLGRASSMSPAKGAYYAQFERNQLIVLFGEKSGMMDWWLQLKQGS